MKRVRGERHYWGMLAHLQHPDTDRLAVGRGTGDLPDSDRYWDQCEPSLRRLIDDVLRLAAVEARGRRSPADRKLGNGGGGGS